jgi:glycosyltransferase involved in cell wall biosynthesis
MPGAASRLPFVSVVIPVLNGERTIKDCLASLLKMDYPPERREIIVVDNGSTDRTTEFVRAHPVTLLREARRGPAPARNRGIEASRGEVLAFTDADCVVSANWLWELVRGFAEGTVAAVEGRTIAYPPRTPAERFAALTGSHTQHRNPQNPFYPCLNTCNVAFRREVFQRLGLFDPCLSPAEDKDFGWRFFAEGDLTSRYQPRAVVWHRHRSTTKSFFLQQAWYGYGLAALRAKYPERLPWGWRQELRAWAAVALLARATAQAAIRYRARDGKPTDASHSYFIFLKKLGVRLGFLWWTLAGGRR